MTTGEKEELTEFRREVKRLKMERELSSSRSRSGAFDSRSWQETPHGAAL